MNKSRKARIKKDIQAYCDISERIEGLESEVEELEKERSKLHERLYDLRPKEYICDAIECFNEVLKDDSCSSIHCYVDALLFNAQSTLDTWDKAIDEWARHNTAAERKKRGLK